MTLTRRSTDPQGGGGMPIDRGQTGIVEGSALLSACPQRKWVNRV